MKKAILILIAYTPWMLFAWFAMPQTPSSFWERFLLVALSIVVFTLSRMVEVYVVEKFA
ncbi:hypothetical protein [Pseudomonas fluorescens]|uniref:hypothetical protein n=1 Tax=Pseudomonas fluorescens TaxID=294 RepID=UPI003D1F7BE0